MSCSGDTKAAALVLALALVAAGARVEADTKTREKVTTKYEGVLARLAASFSGPNFKDGVTSTVAALDNRLVRMSETTGEVVDLDAQTLAAVDPKTKSFSTATFAELRVAADRDKQQAAARLVELPPDALGDELSPAQHPTLIDVDIKDTGRHKSLFKQDAREVIITATQHTPGLALEASGGLVLTVDEWLVPELPALDAVAAADRKVSQAIYGYPLALGYDQIAAINQVFPAFVPLAARAGAPTDRTRGIVAESTTTVETVYSADEMRRVEQVRQGNQAPRRVGVDSGIGGITQNPINPAPPPGMQRRGRAVTLTYAIDAYQPAVTPADVAMPSGYTAKGGH